MKAPLSLIVAASASLCLLSTSALSTQTGSKKNSIKNTPFGKCIAKAKTKHEYTQCLDDSKAYKASCDEYAYCRKACTQRYNAVACDSENYCGDFNPCKAIVSEGLY